MIIQGIKAEGINFKTMDDKRRSLVASAYITSTQISEGDYVLRQKVGTAHDVRTYGDWLLGGIRKSSITSEIKHDEASQQYGNIFIEFKQTFDYRRTWQDSGIVLAKDQADIYGMIYYVDGEPYVLGFDCQRLYQVVTAFPFVVKETWKESNGNQPGAFALGWVVPQSPKSLQWSTIEQFGGFDKFCRMTLARLQKVS